MKDPVNWCAFFSDIEKDPSAITPQLTVRQFYEAREHVYGCDTCHNRMLRTLENSEDKPQDFGSIN